MPIVMKAKNFSAFQDVCKHAEPGAEFHGSSNIFLTCRHKKNIPAGQSWGKCSYKKCPIIERR